LLEIGNWVEADQSTGRILDVPNRKIFNEVLANYTQGFEYIWNEIPVLITFESDWEQAKQLLQEIVDRHAGAASQAAALQVQQASRRYLIRYSKFTPIVYTKKSTSGVLLSMRYLCQARRRRSSEEEIWEDVLRTLGQYPGIEFAYPTQRFYYNQPDGQPPANSRPQVGSQSVGETGD
jgi:small-conductance mechanosensitive channel